MRVRGLVDTGAMIALLDRDDRWHRRCVEALPQFLLPLVTSAAVLAELFHLFGDSAPDTDAAWAFLHSGAVTVRPIDDGDLLALSGLMKRYRDRPMDFADATLVHLARRELLSTVFTVDFNDFETYRIEGRKRFSILPHRDLG